MCLGGGGSDSYNAYEDGQFRSFEKDWNKWANADMRAAKGGTSYNKLNDSSEFDKRIRRLGRDPQAQMEIREMQRQHAVDLGKVAIDENFKKFDPSYFKDYRQDYKQFYNPQVKDQFNESNDKLVASLADRGMLESGVGNNAQAKLFKDFTQARTNIANEAQDASNKLRSNVEQAKSNMYSINEASADPMGVNAQAVGQATALVAPPTYSPLGTLFASAIQPFMNYQAASANSPTRTYTSPYATPQGSGRLVS